MIDPAEKIFGTAEACTPAVQFIGNHPGETVETVASLYRKYGTCADVVRHLNGGFALALHDAERGKLFLARDLSGAVPLYYHTMNRTFAFASDLKDLKEAGLETFDRMAIRRDALSDFLALQYIPGKKTIYEHTFRVLPGEILCFDLATGTFTRDQSLRERFSEPVKPDALPYRDACAVLREKVTAAVRERLTAGTGTFLSGGLDSAILTAVAAQETGKAVPVCSLSNPDPAYDESPLAAETAEWLGLTGQHTIIPFTVPEISALPVPEDLFADSSLIPFSQLCAGTEPCTALLSGDGADELFLGYDRYRAMHLFRYVPPAAARLLAPLIPGGGERTFAGRLKRFLETAALKNDTERYFSIISHQAELRMKDLLVPDLFAVTTHRLVPEISGNLYDLMYYLPDDCMMKGWLGAQSAAVRIRTPFTDRGLTEFALSLPDRYKLKGCRRKRILADAFADLLPPGLSARKKRGFGVPVADWMRKEWRDGLYEHLLTPDMAEWFEYDIAERLLMEHCTGKADHAYLLYSMLIFSLWLEKNR